MAACISSATTIPCFFVLNNLRLEEIEHDCLKMAIVRLEYIVLYVQSVAMACYIIIL